MRVIDHTDQAGRTGSVADLAIVRRVDIDDYSDVRYVHVAAFKASTAPLLSDSEAKAFIDHVNSPEYADVLQHMDMLVAVVNGQLVGTAAWSAGDDSGSSARISSVFVDPMFAGCGIGRRLVRDVEKRAADAGFGRFTIRATANAVPFFQGLGYEVASHGVGSISAADGTMPVTFLRKAAPAVVFAA
jgi:GNAT superfamily N-acetyltransferase